MVLQIVGNQLAGAPLRPLIRTGSLFGISATVKISVQDLILTWLCESYRITSNHRPPRSAFSRPSHSRLTPLSIEIQNLVETFLEPRGEARPAQQERRQLNWAAPKPIVLDQYCAARILAGGLDYYQNPTKISCCKSCNRN